MFYKKVFLKMLQNSETALVSEFFFFNEIVDSGLQLY